MIDRRMEVLDKVVKRCKTKVMKWIAPGTKMTLSGMR